MNAPGIEYVHVRPAQDEGPRFDGPPFIAIVVAEQRVQDIWRWEAARRLVAGGCRYLLAWGDDADGWSDAVDEAHLEAFDYGDIPDDQIVMTTSHADEELEEVFWFARHKAAHPALSLRRTIILHIGPDPREQELRALALAV